MKQLQQSKMSLLLLKEKKNLIGGIHHTSFSFSSICFDLEFFLRKLEKVLEFLQLIMRRPWSPQGSSFFLFIVDGLKSMVVEIELVVLKPRAFHYYIKGVAQ